MGPTAASEHLVLFFLLIRQVSDQLLGGSHQIGVQFRLAVTYMGTLISVLNNYTIFFSGNKDGLINLCKILEFISNLSKF